MRPLGAMVLGIGIFSSASAFGQSGLTVSVPFGGGGINGSLSITAEQGFSRSMTTNGVLATVPNGVPGFAFGGTVSPFVTGLIPVVAGGPDSYRPTGVSLIQRILMRDDVWFQQEPSGRTRVIVGDPVAPSTSAEKLIKADPEPVKPTVKQPISNNSFRRGLEKYGGSKR